jgi:phosphoenolpyruvate synthase/pyruvate phosphate dikinase
MHWLIPFTDTSRATAKNLGGKAMMLARLQQEGFAVPAGYCLPVSVYHEFLAETGLDAFIAMELQRKNFRDMRWEELWDVSLRIRNHFATRVAADDEGEAAQRLDRRSGQLARCGRTIDRSRRRFCKPVFCGSARKPHHAAGCRGHP